ncbi:MAG: FAD-dependent oxidoreductase [Rhodothermaceae bacterium]|nr:FAD-dependent oxidoreductase [Rhodothermaceae bacterium]
MDADVIIAGAGLAGACAALHLAPTRRVLVLDAGQPGQGASGAAAGLVNPFMGRKAHSAWRRTEALVALHATLEVARATALFHNTGVLRPARDARQAEAFADAAAAFPDAARWHGAEATHERWPEVVAPHGALWISDGGTVSIPAMVEALLAAAQTYGATLHPHAALRAWTSTTTGVRVQTTQGDALDAATLLLAIGDGFQAFPALETLPLHRVKGQTVRLARPPNLPTTLPALSGGVYVVPDADALIVGATFEHTFADVDPDPTQSLELRAKAAALLATLADASVLDARAGVRLTVPRTASPKRLPLLGPLPGAPRVWVFTGLGAKGLLTAPLLASWLPEALANPERIPTEVSTLRLA